MEYSRSKLRTWCLSKVSSLIWLVSGKETPAEPLWRRINHKVVHVRDIQGKISKYFMAFNWSDGVFEVKKKSMLHIYILPLFDWNQVKKHWLSSFEGDVTTKLYPWNSMKISKGAYFNISKIHKKIQTTSHDPINIKNYIAHPHHTVHVIGKFREYTAMSLRVTVRKRNVTDRQDGEFQYLPSRYDWYQVHRHWLRHFGGDESTKWHPSRDHCCDGWTQWLLYGHKLWSRKAAAEVLMLLPMMTMDHQNACSAGTTTTIQENVINMDRTISSCFLDLWTSIEYGHLSSSLTVIMRIITDLVTRCG